MMAVEDTFKGAKSGLTFLNAYINGAAKVIGMEQALALDTKICEAMGTAQGNMIKKQTGIEEFDAKTAHQLLWNAVEEGFGILSEVIEKALKGLFSKSAGVQYTRQPRLWGLEAE